MLRKIWGPRMSDDRIKYFEYTRNIAVCGKGEHYHAVYSPRASYYAGGKVKEMQLRKCIDIACNPEAASELEPIFVQAHHAQRALTKYVVAENLDTLYLKIAELEVANAAAEHVGYEKGYSEGYEDGVDDR